MNITQDLQKKVSSKEDSTAGLYQPEFIRIGEQGGSSRLAELLELPEIKVNDNLTDQLRELIKFRNPSRKLSPAEIEELSLQHLGGKPPIEYGVWVFYPWSARLVHILDREEFIDVRTSRNQYKITREERDLLATKKIGVIGLSVGQSVSVTLIMERICGELRLADFDVLELTNLNRIRTGIHNLGLPKVYSVAREVAEIDPFIKVVCFPEGLLEHNMDNFFSKGGKLDLLVEESDGFDIKLLCRYKARELGVPVIMEASDRCMVDVERFDLEPSREILHGIVRNLDIPTLKSLKTNDEKIPYMLDLLGIETTTPRLRASMLEMQESINTWPQLASAVTMGGGITADVSRRILLNQFSRSGRFYVDTEELIGDKEHSSGIAFGPEKEKTSVSETEMVRYVTESAAKLDTTIDDRTLAQLVEAGCMVHSHANKQPWKWISHKGKLYLFHDTARDLEYSDYNGMLAEVSLGAAIENVVLKSAELGLRTDVDVPKERKSNSPVAVISFSREKQKADPLSHYIESLLTGGAAGKSAGINEKVMKELIMTAGTNEVKTELLTTAEKIAEFAAVAGTCERIRMLNPGAHKEYYTRELRWYNDDGCDDGILLSQIGLGPGAETALRVASDPGVTGLLRGWDRGTAFTKLHTAIVSSSSAIGLLSISSDSLQNRINAGRVSQRIWLIASKNNLALQPICLPLAYLSRLRDQKGLTLFSEKEVLMLKDAGQSMSRLFESWTKGKGVFAFRLFSPEETTNSSLKRSLADVYLRR